MRIRGDSLRLRLTRSEVDHLAARGEVRETIHFGGDAKLVYVLRVDPRSTRVEASLRDGEVVVRFSRLSLSRSESLSVAGLVIPASTIKGIMRGR